MTFSYFPNRSQCWIMLAILITNVHFFAFYAILFAPDTFTVRYEIFLLHFLDTETLFQKIKLMTTPMTGTIPYARKAGSLIFVSCDVTYQEATPHTGRTAENTGNGWCVLSVWDNLKSRLLLTDLSNNCSFVREESLNMVSFDFMRQK